MRRWILPQSAYILLNKVIMSFIFFIPLTLIALFESQIGHAKSARLREYFSALPLENERDPKIENPASDEGQISLVSFDDLVKAFPE